MSSNGLPEPCQTSNQLKIMLKPLEKLMWTDYIDGCLENGLFCDVFFQCDDALVGAHRIVVASASLHLADILKGSNQDQVTIILPGISAQILHLYLRLIYGERIVVRKSFLEELHFKFKGIDVALGIAHLRLSKRNTKGKVLTDLDLNQSVNVNAVRCASCDRQMAFNPNAMDSGGDAVEETQSEMQQNEGELAKSLEENGNSLKIHKEPNDREIPVEEILVMPTPQVRTNNALAVPISLSDLQENYLESFVTPSTAQNQIEKPTENFSYEEQCKIKNNKKSLGIMGKKVISKNNNIKIKRKLKKVLKTTILSEGCSKKALENLNKSSVEVLIVQNENFNIDALRQMERLKSVANSVVFCNVCLKEFSCDNSLKYHSKIHEKALGKPTIGTNRAMDPDYGRPSDWKPKVKFNCKTWNLPLTLLIDSGAQSTGARCFTCAICQRRVFGKERANYHVYENHYHELCTLGCDSIPLEIRPDFTKKMRAIEAFKKEKQIMESSEQGHAKENHHTTT